MRRAGVDRVGIVQDDRRVIAAQLQRHALERRGGRLHHLLPRFGRSGEGNLRDVGMAGHRRAEIIVVAQDVDDPGRQYVGAQGAEQQAGERGCGRRLRHHRIARHQRRTQLVHQQHQREIPRRDRADHAQRLAQFDDLALFIVLEQHGLQAHRRKGAQGEGRAHHLHAGLVERLALFAGQQLAEFAGARLQGIGQCGDQGGAFLNRTSGPGREGGPGGGDCFVQQGFVGQRAGGESVAGRGVDDVHGAHAVAQRAVDQQFGVGHGKLR